MIVHWMRVGVVHGVMDTDNMSVPGPTIASGPSVPDSNKLPMPVPPW